MRKYWNIVKNKLVNGLEIYSECEINIQPQVFSV